MPFPLGELFVIVIESIFYHVPPLLSIGAKKFIFYLYKWKFIVYNELLGYENW